MPTISLKSRFFMPYNEQVNIRVPPQVKEEVILFVRDLMSKRFGITIHEFEFSAYHKRLKKREHKRLAMQRYRAKKKAQALKAAKLRKSDS